MFGQYSVRDMAMPFKSLYSARRHWLLDGASNAGQSQHEHARLGPLAGAVARLVRRDASPIDHGQAGARQGLAAARWSALDIQAVCRIEAKKPGRDGGSNELTPALYGIISRYR